MKKFLKKLWNKQKTLNDTIKEKMKMTGHWIAFGILLLIIPIGFGWFGVKYIKKYNLNEQQKKACIFGLGNQHCCSGSMICCTCLFSIIG